MRYIFHGIYALIVWVILISSVVCFNSYLLYKQNRKLEENNMQMKAYIVQQGQLLDVYNKLVVLVREKAK